MRCSSMIFLQCRTNCCQEIMLYTLNFGRFTRIEIDYNTRFILLYIGSAELISSHRQRVADVTPHSDEVDKKPP